MLLMGRFERPSRPAGTRRNRPGDRGIGHDGAMRFEQMTHSAWRRIVLIVVVGLATGVVTQVGQSVLPEGWSQAANAITPWLFVAFLLGSIMPDVRWAAAAGAGALLLALVGYYAMTELRYGIGGGTTSLIVWGFSAIVGGPVFALAGRAWRVGPERQRAVALGLLVSVAVAEGIYNAVVLGALATGAGFVIAGLCVPIVLGRSRDDRLGAYVAAIPALGLAAIGYLALTVFAGVAAGL